MDDVSLKVTRGVNIAHEYWVGLLRREDGAADISGADPVATGHHVGHCEGVRHLNTIVIVMRQLQPVTCPVLCWE